MFHLVARIAWLRNFPAPAFVLDVAWPKGFAGGAGRADFVGDGAADALVGGGGAGRAGLGAVDEFSVGLDLMGYPSEGGGCVGRDRGKWCRD